MRKNAIFSNLQRLTTFSLLNKQIMIIFFFKKTGWLTVANPIKMQLSPTFFAYHKRHISLSAK